MVSPTHSLLFSCLLVACLVSTSQAYLGGNGYVYGYGTGSGTGKSSGYSGKKIMNKIDGCWRWNSNWASNRRALADCAIGFGEGAIGGKYGKFYVVTTPADDPVNPKPGTLRYGVIQTQPLWIIFARDMVIKLQNELIMNSYKTIDGRGAKVEIAYGPCITVQGVSHVIIHGISVHDCTRGKSGMVRSSPTHVGHRLGSDGDAITVFASSNVWIDHCYFARCFDGLTDVTHASTAVTISNNYFTQHDKVMLLGHNDAFTADKILKVTVAFNHFGPECVQRMPRVRFGYAHVVNNRYDQWLLYGVGGSANPTIFSQGNYFLAPNNRDFKQVTKRDCKGGWVDWKWRSSGDIFLNGAYFVQSGYGSCYPRYAEYQSLTAAPAFMVPALTADAGPLHCVPRKLC
ncbi:putative pectate lyase 2 [Macadamia integrifolia]|uniref:putative pectate lyase 2 n=1 Tax=Macadamia integrifolia TaxID=60698 RepID=UPI001C527CB8|nr:putative pectate lyase 2 [Macadamia integrifolia]